VLTLQVSAPISPGWRGTGTILVVDDEAYIRGVATRALENAGFTVLTAANGKEAVAAFREHAKSVRAVLLDLTMPQMDGAATMIQLRQIQPDVRVVLSSGYTEEDATRRFSDRDLVSFLQKPYALSDLIAAVRTALEPSGQ
jgi:CheY-like chemotaxis protein